MVRLCARRTRARAAARGLIVLATWSCSSPPLSAEMLSWVNGGGGLFSTISNWSDLPNQPDRAPGPSDFAHFDLTAPQSFQRVYTVSFVTNPTNLGFTVDDDRVTFNLTGHVYSLTGAFNVGTSLSAFGRLTILNGTVAVPSDSFVRVGFAATGFLTVGAGGLLAGSLMDLAVGNSTSPGSLTIENSGDVIADQTLIAFSASGAGETTVTGVGSSLLANEIQVGFRGFGQLNVVSGGRVETAISIVGNANGSRGIATIQGLGSRWTAGDLTVGRLGNGMLNIVDGGRVVCTTAKLETSQNPGAAPGTVTIAGAGSIFEVNDRLDVAFRLGSGPGTLRVQSGGTVLAAQGVRIGFRGLVQLEGGTLHTPSIIFSDAEASATRFQWTSGTLHAGSFLGDLVNVGGVLAPGASAGSTTVDGDYQHLAAATLQIEIGGIAPVTQYDIVNVIGEALLEGNLQLDLLNGFIPAAADVFTIVGTGGGLTGSFANVANGQRLATSNGVGSFVVNYGAGSVLDPLKVMLSGFRSGIPGDFDEDGDVDGADFLIWQRGGSPAPNSPTDLAVWRSNFGAPQVAVSAAVPEPGVFVLIATPSLLLALARRWRPW
jgi:T5SS/PEP-CTERM-associated repeat protein